MFVTSIVRTRVVVFAVLPAAGARIIAATGGYPSDVDFVAARHGADVAVGVVRVATGVGIAAARVI